MNTALAVKKSEILSSYSLIGRTNLKTGAERHVDIAQLICLLRSRLPRLYVFQPLPPQPLSTVLPTRHGEAGGPPSSGVWPSWQALSSLGSLLGHCGETGGTAR